jgi:tetratricopeptide (TPR) repeat protein
VSQRFIQGGTPFKEVASPGPVANRETLEAYVQRVKALAATARPAPSAAAQPSIESQSPALAAAILQVQLEPSAKNHREAGEAYRLAGVLDVAHKHLTRAVELDPTDARAFDGLARIWRDWGFPNLAFGDVSRALYYAPLSAEAHNTLGTLFQALGRRAEARAAYQLALALDPAASYALNNLCYLSFLDGKGAAAIAECESALRLSPNAAPTRNNLGLVYASLGELQSAHREFSVAGYQGRAAYNMGIVQLSLGHYADAAVSFQDALAADPTLYRAAQRASEARRRVVSAVPDHQELDHGRE